MGKFILFITIAILLCCHLNLSSQTTWKKFFNPPNTRAFSSTMCQTYDNGYLMAGELKVTGYWDKGWIVKSDINGNMLYDKKVTHIDNQVYINCLDTTSDGGFIVGGGFYTSSTWQNSFIMKFNACGEKEWCTAVEPPAPMVNTEFAGGIHELPDGGYIGHRVLHNNAADQDRVSLVKFDHNGSVQWINNYAHSDNGMWEQEIYSDMKVTSDTCFLLTGFAFYLVQPPLISDRAFVLKVKNDGELAWITPWVTPLFNGWGEGRYSIEANNHLSYFTAGTYGGPIPKSYLYKTGIDGDTIHSVRIWDDSLAGAGIAHCMDIYNDSLLLISTQFGRTSSDNWWCIAITDTAGNILKKIVDEEQITFNRIYQTFDNKIITMGVTYSQYPEFPSSFGLYKFNANLEYDSIYTVPRVYDSLCGHSIQSDTIILNDNCTLVSMPDLPMEITEVSLPVYPNPAHDLITVEFPEFIVIPNQYGKMKEQQLRRISGEVSLRIFNSSGVLVYEKSGIPAEQGRILLNLESWESGLYFAQLSQKDYRIATAKFIKQ